MTARLGPGGRAGVTLPALAAGEGSQGNQSPAAAVGSRVAEFRGLLSSEVPDFGTSRRLLFSMGV